MHASLRSLALVVVTLVLAACDRAPSKPSMGFFVTSANPGKGADFGGLEGADRH